MSIMRSHAPGLRMIADRLALASVSALAKRPGVVAVYRVTAQTFDGRLCDSVATFTRINGRDSVLEIAYLRAFDRKPLIYAIPTARCEVFAAALASLSFDRLPDQPNLPIYEAADLWLIERASGTFAHQVVVAPDSAADEYARLVNAINNGLPEAIKQVKVI